MEIPLPSVCSRRAFRSPRSWPVTMIAGPFPMSVETFTGDGTPNAPRLASSSISMHLRLDFPTSMTIARSSSDPASDPTALSPRYIVSTTSPSVLPRTAAWYAYAAIPRIPNRISDFSERTSSCAFQTDPMSYAGTPPDRATISEIWSLMSSASKSTLVNVANSAFMTAKSASPPSPSRAGDDASPTRAPVSSSWSAATSLVLPQTPLLPLQPTPPAVCSHWKQNIGISDSMSSTSTNHRVLPHLNVINIIKTLFLQLIP